MAKSKFEDLPEDLTLLGSEGAEADDFMDCMIGVIYGADVSDRVCYDMEKVIERLMKRNDWNYEDAREYFDFNILGAYVGESSPVYMYLHNVKYLVEKENAERPGTVTDRS